MYQLGYALRVSLPVRRYRNRLTAAGWTVRARGTVY